MNAKETLKEIRAMLGFSNEEEPATFESATLKDGTVIKWEGELAEGTAIVVETAEGDIPAPDATHELEDGTLVTTVEGVVTEMVKPETVVEEVVEEEMAEEFATVARFNEVVESLEGRISELTKTIEALVTERTAHKEAMSKAIDLIERIADLPSAEPEKKPHNPTKVESQFENLKKFANAFKK